MLAARVLDTIRGRLANFEFSWLASEESSEANNLIHSLKKLVSKDFEKVSA